MISRAAPLRRVLDGSRHLPAARSRSCCPRDPTRHDHEPPARILIVEDEHHLADVLQFNLAAEGRSADVAATGELRAANHLVPVLILTALGRPEDVLKDLRRGPMTTCRSRRSSRFSSRASAACRVGEARGRSIRLRGTHDRLRATRAPRRRSVLPLTLMEANLLRYPIEHEGKAVARRSMLEDVWGLHEDTDSAPSTTSWCGCAATSRWIRRNRRISSPFAASATGSSRIRRLSRNVRRGRGAKPSAPLDREASPTPRPSRRATLASRGALRSPPRASALCLTADHSR